jgi:glutathione S-transferase
MPIVVHHLNNSRSQRVLWLLEELGVPYEIKYYQRDRRTGLAPPELRAIHPLGKSPVLEVDGHVLAETGAIVDYIVERFGEGRLRPAGATDERLRYDFWLHYAEGSAMPPLLMKLVFQVLPRRAPALLRRLIGGISRRAQERFIDPQLILHMDYWESTLVHSTWFAGEDFTAADIMMSFPVEAASVRANALASRPRLAAFLRRIHALPAYQRALERGGPYALMR